MIDKKVFGLGLGKTGTTTLGKCLRILGYDHVSCDVDLTRAYREGRMDEIYKIADVKNAFEDFPWPLMYREMYKRYPTSKFVLTTRTSSDVWFESLVKHADRTGESEHKILAYGHAMPHGKKAEHVTLYEEHNASVRNFFADKPGQFLELCWEHGHGWSELCDFLGHEVPEASFPWANRAPRLFDSLRRFVGIK